MDLQCLVVDDHRLMRDMVINNLKAIKLEGVNFKNIENAPNGLEAYTKLEAAFSNGKTPFNLVFLDWNMPVMDGYELLSKCRKDKKYDSTAFVMLTAESEQSMVIKAINTGATSYICKPFKASDLDKKLVMVIEWLKKNGKK